jgi:hypothetical protein
LDTKKSNLRLVLVDKFTKRELEALGSTVLANGAYRSLHDALELAKPVLNVAFALNGFVKGDGFSSATPVLVNLLKETTINLVESNTADSIEHLFEIILNLVRVSTNGQNLKKIRVRAEVEAREYTSLLLKISLELTLAVLEVLLHLGERAGQKIVLAAWDDELLLGNTLHNFLPLGISSLEDLGLSRHLLGDFTTGEYKHKGHPLLHDLEPLFESLLNLGESIELRLHLSTERSNTTSGKHLNQVHHVLFKLLLDIIDGATDGAREVEVLVGLDFELSVFPVSIDILTKLLLNLLLLESRVADILDVLLYREEVSIEQLLESECLGLVRDLFASEFNQLFPMAILDALITEHLDERKNDLHIIESLLKLLVSRVLLGVRGELKAVLEELLNTFLHGSDLGSDLKPWGFFPLGDSLSNLKVKSVKLIKLVELVLSLHKSRVLLVRKSEELLTGVIRLILSVVDRELLLKVLQLVEGLTWGQIGLHGTVLFEILAEDLNLNDESVNVLDELFLELRLVVVKVVTNDEGLDNKLIPLLLQVFALIKLIAVHLKTVLNESVHVRDGLELEVDVRLLLADLLKGEHNAAKRVDILDLLVDLQTDLFDVISEVAEEVLGLLVNVLGEHKLPLAEVVLESILHALSLQRQSTNLVGLLDLLNLSVLEIEVLELIFEVIEVRVLLAEYLQLIFGLAGPEP